MNAAMRPVSSSLAAPEEIMSEYLHALFLDMKGDYRGAIVSYKKVLEVMPSEPVVRFSISKAFLRMGVPDSARVHGEAAVKLDPENRHYLVYLAVFSHSEHDYARAAELYGQASLVEPGRAEALTHQGLEYLSSDKPELALEAFRSAVRIDPYHEDALSRLLVLEIGLKRYPEAIDTARQLQGLGGNERKLRLTLAELYEKSGQEALSLQTLRELVESDRSDLTAWSALFNHAIKAGKVGEFHRELREFLAVKPLPSKKIVDLVRMYVSRSAPDSIYAEPVKILFDEVAALQPRNAEIELLKGIYAMKHDRKREGLECFRKAVQFDDRNVSAWEFMITAHFDLNEKRNAFKQLLTARRRFPAHRLKWQQIEGYLLLHSGAPKRAAVVLEKVLASRQKVSDTGILIRANLDLAASYDLLGQQKRTLKLYEKVLKLDAHNTIAMNNLAFLLAEEGIRLQQAFLLASNAVMLDPENGVYLDTLGWVHFKLGNYDIARQLFEKAIAAGTEEAEIYQHLGQSYRELGNEPKAIEMFGKAKSINRR
ncbi:MAG: tetratricopeptide repeat protein [Chlorobiaceae bacterium]|nr:tetratricopeptide repeat protein [Chlorobiaceae bacterium]